MSNSKKIIVSVCMMVTMLIFLTNDVFAAPTTERLWGQNRYETAAAICSAGWKQCDYAIIANGENFPDALSAAPLAKKYNAPILLTGASYLEECTKVQLQNLNVKNVFIIGGTGVVSEKVKASIGLMNINVKRLDGKDRYETAIKVASEVGVGPNGVIFTTGDDFPDAVSVASVAAQKSMPIVLLPKDYLTDSIKKFLESSYIEKSYVIGGSDIISDTVVGQLKEYKVKRIIGSNKYERNAAIIKEFSGDLDFSNVFIANGESFPDALAGSALASLKLSPIILVNSSPWDVTKNLFSENSIDKITVLGGEGVVTPSVVSTLSQAVSANPSVSSSGNLSIKEISKNSNAVVYIEAMDSSGKLLGTGSGFIVTSNGKIVTNYHVIEDAYSASVTTESGDSYDVDGILNYSKEQDIAILKLKSASSLPIVKLGDSSDVEIADGVVAIGSPEGYKNTVSSGIISGLERESSIRSGKDIQFTAAITYGSSGGCLFNMKGEVIGITYSGYETGNLGFAIPINEVIPMLNGGTLKDLSSISYKLKPPTGVIAWAVSKNEIRLKWDKVSDADYYKIYKSSYHSGPYQDVKNSKGDNYWSWYSDYSMYTSNLDASTTIYYKVTAVKDGIESDYSEIAYATTLSDKPNPPTGVTATAVSSSEIHISWNKVEGADYYKAYNSSSYYGSYSDIINSKDENKWYWDYDYCINLGDIPSNTTRYIKITAVVNGIESDASTIVSATTLKETNYYPLLSDIPCVPDVDYCDYSINDDGIVIYKYRVSDLPISFAEDYTALLDEEGWKYYKTEKINNMVDAMSLKKDDNLIVISYSENYFFISGFKH